MWFLVLLGLWLCGSLPAAAQTPVWSGATAGPRVSVIEIPLAVDLRPLFRRADTLLPREAGHWRGWRKQYGIETRYRAWRGPLRMVLTGDLLRVETHVRYWVQGRKRIFGGLDLAAGCGVDEPSRQAIIGLQVQLGWGPDWTLRPGFRVLPTRFIDRCEVTAAGIDVSPIIDGLFRRRLEESLHTALEALGPRLTTARSQAERYWQALQRPVEVTPGLWLTTEPLALALAPPWGRGDLLETKLGLVMVLSLGPEPTRQGQLRPLPPLQAFFPRGAGMRFLLDLDLDLRALGAHLSGMLADQPLEVEGHRIGIGRVDLKGEENKFVLTAVLTGDATGRIELWARPVFDPATQRMRLEDLDFIFDPEDPDQALGVNLFYQRIQKALQDAGNELLTARVDGLREALESALSRSVPENPKLNFSSLRLAELSLTLAGSALHLRGMATGSLAVTAR